MAGPLAISFKQFYEHATMWWYKLSYVDVSQNFVHAILHARNFQSMAKYCLYVRHKMCAICKVMHKFTHVTCTFLTIYIHRNTSKSVVRLCISVCVTQAVHF